MNAHYPRTASGWIPYDGSHIRATAAKQRADELRAEGRTVRLGSYVKDYVLGEGLVSYCKLYVRTT
jgi:hypothetical protein